MKEILKNISEEFEYLNEEKRRIENKPFKTEKDQEDLEAIEELYEHMQNRINSWASEQNKKENHEKSLRERFEENRDKIEAIKNQSKKLQPKIEGASKANKQEILERNGFIKTNTIDNREVYIHPSLVGKYYDLVKEQRLLSEELNQQYYEERDRVKASKQPEIILESNVPKEEKVSTVSQQQSETLEEKEIRLNNERNNLQNEINNIIQNGKGKKQLVKYKGEKYYIPERDAGRFTSVLMPTLERLNTELENLKEPKAIKINLESAQTEFDKIKSLAPQMPSETSLDLENRTTTKYPLPTFSPNYEEDNTPNIEEKQEEEKNVANIFQTVGIATTTPSTNPENIKMESNNDNTDMASGLGTEESKQTALEKLDSIAEKIKENEELHEDIQSNLPADIIRNCEQNMMKINQNIVESLRYYATYAITPVEMIRDLYYDISDELENLDDKLVPEEAKIKEAEGDTKEAIQILKQNGFFNLSDEENIDNVSSYAHSSVIDKLIKSMDTLCRIEKIMAEQYSEISKQYEEESKRIKITKFPLDPKEIHEEIEEFKLRSERYKGNIQLIIESNSPNGYWMDLSSKYEKFRNAINDFYKNTKRFQMHYFNVSKEALEHLIKEQEEALTKEGFIKTALLTDEGENIYIHPSQIDDYIEFLDAGRIVYGELASELNFGIDSELKEIQELSQKIEEQKVRYKSEELQSEKDGEKVPAQIEQIPHNINFESAQTDFDKIKSITPQMPSETSLDLESRTTTKYPLPTFSPNYKEDNTPNIEEKQEEEQSVANIFQTVGINPTTPTKNPESIKMESNNDNKDMGPGVSTEESKLVENIFQTAGINPTTPSTNPKVISSKSKNEDQTSSDDLDDLDDLDNLDDLDDLDQKELWDKFIKLNSKSTTARSEEPKKTDNKSVKTASYSNEPEINLEDLPDIDDMEISNDSEVNDDNIIATRDKEIDDKKINESINNFPIDNFMDNYLNQENKTDNKKEKKREVIKVRKSKKNIKKKMWIKAAALIAALVTIATMGIMGKLKNKQQIQEIMPQIVAEVPNEEVYEMSGEEYNGEESNFEQLNEDEPAEAVEEEKELVDMEVVTPEEKEEPPKQEEVTTQDTKEEVKLEVQQTNDEEAISENNPTIGGVIKLNTTTKIYRDEINAYLDDEGEKGLKPYWSNETDKILLGGLYEDANGNFQYIYYNTEEANQKQEQIIQNGGKLLSALIAEPLKYYQVTDGTKPLTISQINQCAAGWIKGEDIQMNNQELSGGMHR